MSVSPFNKELRGEFSLSEAIKYLEANQEEYESVLIMCVRNDGSSEYYDTGFTPSDKIAMVEMYKHLVLGDVLKCSP
jgi:hypothetical protein